MSPIIWDAFKVVVRVGRDGRRLPEAGGEAETGDLPIYLGKQPGLLVGLEVRHGA